MSNQTLSILESWDSDAKEVLKYSCHATQPSQQGLAILNGHWILLYTYTYSHLHTHTIGPLFFLLGVEGMGGVIYKSNQIMKDQGIVQQIQLKHL